MPYVKEKALEYLFNTKYSDQDSQLEIPFTREELAEAIVATGGTIPHNLNNFVKDLVRTGNADPRSPSARLKGYLLMEGSHSTSMGIFFKPAGGSTRIAITCPAGLEITNLQVKIPEKIIDIIRTDEGGLLSVLNYTNMLDDFFKYLSKENKSVVYTVQIPVKLQPHEIDGLFLLVDDKGQRIPIACEAKSQGNDSIMLNQIIGVTRGALQRIAQNDMDYVIPLGTKLLSDGTIFLVSFKQCNVSDIDNLGSLITPATVEKMARYSIDPVPPKWLPKPKLGKRKPKPKNPSATKQLPL